MALGELAAKDVLTVIRRELATGIDAGAASMLAGLPAVETHNWWASAFILKLPYMLKHSTVVRRCRALDFR